jgi:hypothetical protein
VREARRSSMVVRALKGALRSHARQIARKCALPTVDLRDILSSYPTNTATLPFNDLIFISILLTGFFGLLRLGELTLPDDPSLIHSSKTMLRESLRMTSTTYRFLPVNKTDPFFERNRVVIRSTSDELDPRSPSSATISTSLNPTKV